MYIYIYIYIYIYLPSEPPSAHPPDSLPGLLEKGTSLMTQLRMNKIMINEAAPLPPASRLSSGSKGLQLLFTCNDMVIGFACLNNVCWDS